MKTGGYYTLTSVCIFSILFSIHPKVLTRRICLMIKSTLTLLSFLYSYDLTFSFRGDNVRRNQMPLTLRSLELTGGPSDFGMLILYSNIILQSHPVVQMQEFLKKSPRGGGGESVNNCALFEFRIIIPDYYNAYYKYITNYLFLNITDRVLY